ncbi:MBOAT family O-acyltransferase [uncultured Ezakiella sp.]|uniref:MBOAT family O-acyltransferase n=1 Tax=uncultured Ezakiella sp. TaxID=1637529 RepID=UPI0025FEAD8A|nr:MBOAT family O-acyltransferase [uncultured Ezakiella sp.]
MVFSSIIFLFYFLPITLIVNLLLPRRYRNAWLLLMSMVFYAWGEPKYLLIMIVNILLNYILALLMEGKSPKTRKLLLLISILFSVGNLFAFKYAGLLSKTFEIDLPKLALPLGISFYTFQTMSYTIDVYRKKVGPQKNLIDFSFYIVSFPQLIAGPIVKYTDIKDELKSRDDSLDALYDGMMIFFQGLFLKVLLANNFGIVFNLVEFDQANSVVMLLIKIFAYAFQIYFDFQGYSLMAIGLGRALGFHFPKNFNHPYMAQSVTDFWTRWHMTLSSWFKEYVYIPLGGNRVRPARHIFNLFVTWALTGLWHGANYNFILWGIYYFLVLIIEKYILSKIFAKAPVFLKRIYTLAVVLVGWLIFIAEDFSILGTFFNGLFKLPFTDIKAATTILQYGSLFVLGFIFATDWPEKLYEKMRPWVRHILFLILFIFSAAFIVSGSFNPFLYFRF